MRNFFIFLSIFVVLILATLDATDRLNELESIAVKTPAQVEVKQDMIENTREKKPDYKSPANPQNNSFNQRIINQQNNNLPQTKQNNPLTKD